MQTVTAPMSTRSLMRALVIAILAPELLSFIAWALPLDHFAALGFRGFSDRSQTSFSGWMMLVTWYALVLAVCVAAFAFASRGAGARQDRVVEFDRATAGMLVALTVAGTLYSLFKISRAVSLIGLIRAQSFNEAALQLGGAAGPQTLRYAAAPAVGFIVWGVITRQCSWRWLPIPVGCWLFVSALGSRLSIIMAAWITLALLWASGALKRYSARQLTAIGTAVAVALFTLAVPLNYIRNANYYRAHGIANPIIMNISQTLSYLAAPTQVSIWVADQVITGQPLTERDDRKSTLDVIKPTYLSAKQTVTDAQNHEYASSLSLDQSLTANSVFADTVVDYGLGALPFQIVLMGLFAGLMGACAGRGSQGVLVTAVCGYGFVELWRTPMFTTGILDFLVLITLGALGFRAYRTRSVAPSTRLGYF